MTVAEGPLRFQSSNISYKIPGDPHSECLAQMASHELPYDGPLNTQGKICRFRIGSKKNKDGWYVAWDGTSNKGNVYLICIYGSWKTSEKFEYRSWSEGSLLSEQEIIELQRLLQEKRKAVENAIKAEQNEVATECQQIWEQIEGVSPKAEHLEYLKNKGVKNYGLRFGNNEKGYPSIIIPLRNAFGAIRSLQYISVGKDGTVYKTFHTGGEKKGNHFVIGVITNGQPCYVCEGYATGVSSHEAIEQPVVVAFDCNNLSPVIDNLRKAYPESKIVILADNDQETQDQKGKLLNPGKTAAEEASKRYECSVILPEFPSDFRLPNGKRPSDFNDLHAHFGLNAVKKQIENIENTICHTTWEDPMPLPDGIPPVASLEPDMLPDALRAWIIDIAERMQIPPDFSAAAAIIVLSSLIGRNLRINPKEKDDWLVVPNLWGAIVGRPSLMKSSAISEIMKPINEFVIAAKAQHDEEMKKNKFKAMIIKAQERAFEKKLNKVATDIDKLNALIPPDIETSDEPAEKRYKTEDGTIAKIGEILLKNPRGILIHRDELTGWFKSLDMDGREGDRSFFLESWNGSGGFTVDRIGRGTLHIPALCLSILGGIQPGPISSYVYQATKGGVGDDGLLQRFQLVVWPDFPKDWKNIDRWPDTDAKKRAHEVFKKIDSYEHPEHEAESSSPLDIPAVRFSPEGQQVFNLWRENLEKRLRSGDLSPAMEAHLAKYRSLMPSLALIFQLCQDVDHGARVKKVECSSAEMAVRWCAYLETHARRLYACAENPNLVSAKALLQCIERESLTDGFTLRDVYRSRWSKLSSLEEAKNATDILVEYGWIRCEKHQTATKSKTIFILHPQLRQVQNCTNTED